MVVDESQLSTHNHFFQVTYQSSHFICLFIVDFGILDSLVKKCHMVQYFADDRSTPSTCNPVGSVQTAMYSPCCGYSKFQHGSSPVARKAKYPTHAQPFEQSGSFLQISSSLHFIAITRVCPTDKIECLVFQPKKPRSSCSKLRPLTDPIPTG